MIIYILSVAVLYVVTTFLGLKPARGILGCGLYGFSGTHPVDLAKIRWLVNLNQSRGSDSTGIYTFKNDKAGTEILYKDNKKAEIFIMDDKAVDALRGAYTLIGHTRQATKGATTAENSHPFLFQDKVKIVGAHNGFVTDEYVEKYVKEFELEKLFNNKDPEVDSQVIFAALAKTGDYNTLSKIEGGLTTLHVEPIKYNNTIFAYKRAARPLHYGIAKEGIYISSLEDHLRLVGCDTVGAFDDNTLTLLKDGKILDVLPMEAPKINVYMNQTRGSFGGTTTTSEWSRNGDYEELPFTNRQRVPVVKEVVKVAPKTTMADSYDTMRMIVKDALEEIAMLDPSQFKSVEAIKDFECGIDAMLDCLLLIQLVADVKDQTLPAWTVFDKNNEEYSSITGLNGVAMIKMPLSECDKEHDIQIFDPIDGQTVYTFKVTPKSGTVQEVAVQIPFQEDKRTKSEKDKDSVLQGKRDNTLVRLGRILENGIRGVMPKGWSVLSPNTGISTVLPKEDEHIRVGHTEEENTGGIRQRQNLSGATDFSESVPSKRNRPFTKYELELVDKLIAAHTLATDKNLESTDIYNGTREFVQIQRIWNYYVGAYVDLEELLEDASRLKHYVTVQSRTSKSLGYYMMVLLDYSMTPPQDIQTDLGVLTMYARSHKALPWTYLKIKTIYGNAELRTNDYNDKIAFIKKFLNGFESGAVMSVPDNASQLTVAPKEKEEVPPAEVGGGDVVFWGDQRVFVD